MDVKIKTSKLFFLDVIRGLAALYVTLSHGNDWLWDANKTYNKQPKDYNQIEKIFKSGLSIFNYSHLAVMFFFVLSGFVIHLRYSKKLSTDNSFEFDYFPYVKRRFRRIFPPLLFALIFTFLMDSLGNHFLHFKIYDPEIFLKFTTHLYNDSLLVFLGNMAFLMEIFIPCWGSNQALWTLSYEWWLYMLYPLFFLLNRKSFKFSWVFVFIIFILFFLPKTSLISNYIYENIHLIFTWYLGVFLSDIYSKRINISYNWLFPLAILIPINLFFPGLSKNFHVLYDTLLAVGIMGVLAFFLWLEEKEIHISFLRYFKWLGDCSYTLYVTNLPIMIFLGGYIMKYHTNSFPFNFLLYFLGCAVSIIFAYVVHFLVEKPFMRK